MEMQQQVVEYASLNRRLIGACIDSFITFILFSPLLNYIGEFIGPKILLMHSITITVLAIYCIGFWYKFGATPGKYFCNCRIVNRADLQPPSLFRLVTRFLGYIIFLGLGLLTISFTKQNQALHDKIAKTVVIVMKPDFSWLSKIGISNIRK